MRSAVAAITIACLAIALLPGPVHALRPVREYAALPSDYGIIYQDVTFGTADGVTIKGWFFPAQDTTGIANRLVGHIPVPEPLKQVARPYATIDGSKRPTIIICNGDAGNMSYLILYAYNLFIRGFNVLTFDWRGFGGSGDWPIDENYLCYAEFLSDYDAAIDFVRKRSEVDAARMGVFGFSTGAYLSFAIAARRSDIAAFAGRALMTSFDDVLPILRRLKPARTLTAPANYPKDLLPINAAGRMKIPVLLIVGEKDDRTPPWMSRRILAELKGPKELWIIEGAEHGGGEGPEYKCYAEFFRRLAEFYGKSL